MMVYCTISCPICHLFTPQIAQEGGRLIGRSSVKEGGVKLKVME